MPAMAPPESPEPPLLAPAADGEDVAVEDVEDVLGKKGGIDVVIGNLTFSHLDSACAFTQQESVELGELAAQREHRPGRFVPKPQSSGSFSTPCMHVPDNELLGFEQTVKSARICLMALSPGVPQRSGLDMICCSLAATSYCSPSAAFYIGIGKVLTHTSAHSGRVALPVRPHGSTEFCTMPLQINVVV